MSIGSPLPEQMRPLSLKDVIGHGGVVGKGEILDKIIATKKPVSMILWGPPGTGKTTLARIIAKEVDAECIELSAVTSGIADVRKVIEHAKANRRLGMQTILFVDEIHRFNKSQQDAFLPHVENGTVTLIGATTENPSFEVIQPLLSRMRVVVLERLSDKDIVAIGKRALKKIGYTGKVSVEAWRVLARVAGGDARVALGTIELALSLGQVVSAESLKKAALAQVPAYDKGGDIHYHLASAFIKSLRGSDANGAIYYLARMLQGGEDPKFIARRMIVFASEDIGIASSPALNLAVSTFLAVERVGMPEVEYVLYHCAIVLAGAKKSRVVTDAMTRAKQTAKETDNLAVPLHLRNASNNFLTDMNYAKGYEWQAGFKPDQGFLPPSLKDVNFFR